MPRAGLDASVVTEAGATLADEIGIDRLSMSLVAERLGVKAPSLYKHVDSLASLTRGIALLGATELGDAIRDATQGRAGGEALSAAAHAVRAYVTQHPGRYAATTGVRPADADDPLVSALDRTISSLAAALRGYRLEADEEIHAIRMLRSMLHGFATLEVAGGFQLNTDVDASFDWMIDFIDQGFRGRRTE